MQGLISDKLVALIEQNADKIIRRWTERLSADPATPSFSSEALDRFDAKAHMVMQELGEWISYDKPQEDIIRHYAQEGSGLFRLGIPLCEGARALILLKRTLWLFVLESSLFESAMELLKIHLLPLRVISGDVETAVTCGVFAFWETTIPAIVAALHTEPITA